MKYLLNKITRLNKKLIKKIKKVYYKFYERSLSDTAKISKKEIVYNANTFNVRKETKDETILHLIVSGKVDVNESYEKLKFIEPILDNADYTICSIDEGIRDIDYGKFPFNYYINDKINRIANCNHIDIVNFQDKAISFVACGNSLKNSEFKKIISNAKKKSDYIICFYNYHVFNEEKVNNLFDFDVDYVIGINQSSKYRMEYLCENNNCIIRSLGKLTSKKFKNYFYRDSILLNLKFQVRDGCVKLVEDSYIPIFNATKVNGERNVAIPINMEEYNEKTIDVLDYSRRRIADSIIDLKEEQRYLNIKKIFEILNLDVPNNCLDVRFECVKKLCTSIGQTIENSVLFIRPYDGKVYEFSEEEHIEKLQELIYKAEEKRALLIFTPYHLSDIIPEVITENPLLYHDEIIKYIVSKLNLKIKVGVTGSVGKTTTKELIYNALKYKYSAARSMHNSNTVRIGLHLQKLRPNVEAFVQELGGGKIGRAEGNAKMLGLTSGVVTNVENAHLRMSGSREQLLINKVGIQKGIRHGGPLFINIDNDMLDKYKTTEGVITYSLTNSDADYYAEDIVFTSSQSKFYVCRKDKRTKVVINLLGEHNVLDALVAFAVSEDAKVEESDILEGLLEYKPKGIRQNIVDLANKTLYVDCFNSNYASLVASTEHLQHIAKDNRKILVLSDYTGLAEENEQAHIDTANYLLQKNYDLIVLYGEDVKIIRDILKEKNKKVFQSDDSVKICECLEKEMQENDYILFKGSSKFELEKTIIDELFGTTMSYQRARSNGVRYIYTDEGEQKFVLTNYFAAIYKKSNILLLNGVLNIPESINELPLRSIFSKSFYNNENITKVVATKNLKNIKTSVFTNCTNLESVILPSDFKMLNRYVFMGCKKLKHVNIGKSIVHIGDKAFYNCSSLTELYLPSSLKYIGNDAFVGCEKLTIVCERDSYAHTWAQNNSVNFKFSNVVEKSQKINLYDYIFDRELTRNIVSHNAFIGVVLQTGEFFAYSEGNVSIEAILKDGTTKKIEILIDSINEHSLPILINRYNGIGKNYVANNLVYVDRKYILSKRKEEIQINERAYNSFIEMYNDAKKENIDIRIAQGYRDKKMQMEILEKTIKSQGIDYANSKVAPPGFSQHNLGLAIDLCTDDTYKLETMYKWIEINSYKYGYCLKNLEGKEHITGSIYEPWHLYFIDNIEIAKELRDKKITLEEYLIKVW